jgi:SWI/SNF-related matrix-associated actin-dependent regulator 1 of chromatin subfamily A
MLGTIQLVNNQLEVVFKYNTDCFQTIRKFDGVNFDKSRKIWTVPIKHAASLLKSKYFSADKFRYDFSVDELKQKLQQLESAITLSRARATANPFSVSEEDIAILPFNVVFRADPQSNYISAECNQASRKAIKLLGNSAGLIKTKSKRKFLLSSSILNNILKSLRENACSFAVEKSLAEKLKSTSSIRSGVARGEYLKLKTDYDSARLAPCIDFDPKKNCFYGYDFLPQVKEVIIPSKKSVKKNSFEVNEVFEVLLTSQVMSLPVYLTCSAFDNLQQYSKQIITEINSDKSIVPDEAIILALVSDCWRIASENKGALQLSEESIAEFPIAEQNFSYKEFNVVVTQVNGYTILTPSKSKLILFYEYIKSLGLRFSNCPITKKFSYEITRASKTSDALKKQYYYQTLSDTDLNLSWDKTNTIAQKLYPHQRVAIKWMLENDSGMLGDDMGLGKTVSALIAYEQYRYEQKVDFLLVLSPNSLVRNWIRESNTWCNNLVLRSPPESKKEKTQFLEALSENRLNSIDGLVINFESMRTEQVWPTLQAVCQQRSVFLIVDESQRIKNPLSKTFVALRNFGLLAKKRFLLTGTPTPRDIADIWAQMFLIDGGKRLGTKFREWLKTVAELGTKWSEYAVKRFIPAAVDEVTACVQEVLLRRKKEDVLNLPEKVFLYRDVELTSDQQKRFDLIKEELRVQVGKLKSGEEKTKTIESVLEEYLRAVQICSNPRLIDPTWEGTPAKFSELDDIVDDVCRERGEKIVIWSNYLLNINELTARYADLNAVAFSGEVSTADREKNIRAFQSTDPNSPKVLVAIPAAGGVGITLTAAQTAVYIDRTWNAEHWLQSIDRIHRIGQVGTVRILVLNGSKVDELIGYNLHRKKLQMDKLLSGNMDLVEQMYPTVEQLLEAIS